MAVKPSNAALTALRNNRREKQNELVGAYTAMGGSDTALLAKPTIPKLESAIDNLYQTAQSGGRSTYNDLQAMTPAYNEYRNQRTANTLSRLGQTDIARGSNSFDVERAKEGHMQSGLLNSLAVNEKLGRLVTSLTGNAAPYEAFRMTQDNAMKGTLTDEMRSAGLTQEDIDRWNRQQNDIERQQVLTNYAAQHPFMATVNSFPEMVAGSAEGVLDKLTNYVQGKPLESSPINAELYRSAVTQNMSKPGNFAYGVGTSIGDMLLALTAGTAAGPGIMGVEKANSVMNDAIERGLTPNQTVAEGIASGVSTGLTESIPFGRLQRGGHIAGSALAEGLQEGSEDIVDTIFDELITRAGGNNEKSVLNRNLQMYRDAGYSEEDARTAVVVDYLKQLGLDSLAGLISGGVMQGGTNVLNQRNVITGRPRTNVETESNVTADAEPETIPVLRNSIEEEAAATTLLEQQRADEMAQLSEAYAQIQAQQADEQRRAEQLAREETAQNYDPEEMEFLRNLTRETSEESRNWELPVDESRSAEEVITELKNRVINELQTNEPLAGEHVNDLVNRLNYVAQNNPQLQPFINEQLSEVMRESEGWVTDFGNQQIPQVRNVAETQTAESDARQMVDSFIQDLESGNVSNPMNTYADVLAELTETAQSHPELRENLNGMLREVNAAMPNQNVQQTAQNEDAQVQRDNEGLDPDVANIQTEEDAERVISNEAEKLDNTLRMDLQFHSESNQTIPSVKDNGVHTGIYRDSKLATNTYPNSGIMTEEEYDRVIPEDIRKTERVTHEATLNKAEENVRDNGYNGEYDRLLKDDNWDAADVDTAMLCAMREAENARNAEALGIDPDEAWGREVAIFKKAKNLATAGGQMIEAFKKWSAMTAEGKLAQAISFINEAVTEVKNENALPKDVKTAADRYLSDEVIAEFLKKAHQYDGQNPTLLQQARLNAELAHMINECIPVRFRQKFRSLWMDNLLASIRTLISRNFGGNIGKAALDQTLVKMISGPVDNFISRYTGTRTTTGFTREGWRAYRQGFVKGGKQTITDYWTPNSDPDAKLKLKDLAKNIEVFADANVTNRSGVDELNFKEAIRGNRTTFKSKAFKLYDKIIKFGLAIGDNPFYKGTYDQTVLELNTLREQGKIKLPEDITDEEFEQWVKVCATARGLEAVYQDNSELAQGAMDIKNGLAKVSNGFMGFDPLSNTAMPFVSTPMNVVKTNLELSPLGIVKNAAQTIKEIRSNLENGRTALDSQSFDQQRFVRETSRNIVGLLLFATGLMLKNAGYLTGGYSEDDKEAQAQKDAGMQEYALVSPFTGNQWSINWIPGLGSTFAAASAFEDAYSKPDQDTADALINGAKAGAQSLFEQAALQGLQRLTGSANYNSDNKIVDNVVQTIANTASSAIVPSIVRQSAAALDPYKRNTYGTGGKESIINNAIAGLPYLRTHMLEPRIGMNGQPITQNAGRNTVEKWFDNLVNPAMVTVPSALANPVRDEATRLYEETKDSSAFQPKISVSYLAVDGHVPTTEEYTEFLQIADTAMNQIASDFIESPFYSTLTDEQRVDTLNDIYGTVQRVERAKYLGIDKDFDGADKAYFEGGAEGLTNYLTASTALNQLGLSNNDKNREAVLSALERNGSGSLPNIMSTYESNFDRAWQQLSIGGDIYNRYSGMTSFLNDEQYEDLANDMSSTIRTVEANRAIGYNREYTEAAKAYANGGVQGLVEYLYPATLLKQYGMDNNEKNRQGIMDAYNEGGANAVRSQLDAMQVFSGTAYGDGLNYRYNHATNYLPSLTPSQFASLYDTVDQQDKGTSGFNTITQQEVIDYLNRDPGAYNSETALQYWNAFDQHAGSDDQWKKIPVLVNGEWQAKKA